MTMNERGKEGRDQMGQKHLKQSQNPNSLYHTHAKNKTKRKDTFVNKERVM
jgi:hypothetical protein